MHRHGYKGTKFHRQRNQRQALLKSLADALILSESIETTLPKAREVARYTEKLISSAKSGLSDLHDRRKVISSLATLEASHKLVDEIAPKLTARSSGYLRIQRTNLRRGDGAQMAKISFVDNLKTVKKSQVKTGAKPAEQPDDKVKKDTQPIAAIRDSSNKIAKQNKNTPAQAPRRSGVRGNR